MQRVYKSISMFAAVFALIAGTAGIAAAQRVNTREVRDTVRGLNTKIDDFDYTLRFQLRSSSASRQEVDDATAGISNLKEKVAAFEENLNLRRENRNDVNEIITAAQDVKGFLRSNPQNRRIETTWTDIERLIEKLAANYGVTPDWTGRISNASRDNDSRDNDSYDPIDNSGPIAYSGPTSDFTGTYRLEPSRSESVSEILGGISVSAAQRQDLETKLEAPEQIALSVRGNRVTIASSSTGPVSFIADGTEQTESVNGRTVRVRAALSGNELTLTSLGGDTDYTVTFSATNGGQELKVTRRITTEYLDETVFAESFYSRSDRVAGLGINDNGTDTGTGGYSSSDANDRAGANSPNPTLSRARVGQYVVPNGVVIIGSLDNEINTKASQNNDRFKMTVQSPMEYRGAVIEGYITGVGRSGQVSGRSNVTFNFERITLRDGKSYDFAGNLKAVRDEQGKDVKIDAEGTAKGDSQTKETAKRGGIGAGLGAIIGAIAGGGKGAVIGAIIGGGAGAGSVAVMGRDDVRLMPGSTITVESSSPIANGQR